MPSRRDIRRCALQVLYQLDAVPDVDPLSLQDSLRDGPGDETSHAEGLSLAHAAWAVHEDADAAVASVADDWPTHRQPAIDRNLLRLAWHEISSGHAPPRVVIDEAVELAREYSTPRSSAFINGVLDRLFLHDDEAVPPPT